MTHSSLNNLVTLNVQRPGKKYTQLIPRERYDALVTDILLFLSEENDGYIAPWELMECRGFLEKTNSLETTDFQRAKARIARLKNAGIPPLYENTGSIIPTSWFPIVDFMIQFPTGRVQHRWAGQHAGNRVNPRKSFIPRIYPSSLDDILEFRTIAFDGDHISPQVIRDLVDYASEKETGEVDTEAVIQADLLRLKYLELLFADIKPRERNYQSLTGDYFDFMGIGRRFWHTAYTPEDREKIASRYVKGLTCGGLGYDSKKHKRMRVLFPEIVQDLDKEDMTRKRNEATIEKCRSAEDYTQMPKIALIDGHYGTKPTEQLKEHVKKTLQELMETEKFVAFQRLQDLHDLLKVPYGSLFLTEFRDIITAERLKLVNSIDNATFVELFENKGRFMSIGHRQEGSWKESLVDQQFRGVLIQRYRSLVGD